jgi:hypothetical protein
VLVGQHGRHQLHRAAVGGEQPQLRRHGNLTAAGSTTYAYNAKNQTTQVGGTTFTYTDADSTERSRRSSSSESTTFFNSALGVTAQTGNMTNVGYTRDPNGNLIDMRVSAVGDTNYQSNFYTTDRLDSTLQLNDSSVAATASYGYDAYGFTTSGTGSQAVTNPYRHASGMTDPTSLIKFGTRYPLNMIDPPVGTAGRRLWETSPGA